MINIAIYRFLCNNVDKHYAVNGLSANLTTLLLNLVACKVEEDRVAEAEANGSCMLGGVVIIVDVQGQGSVARALAGVVVYPEESCATGNIGVLNSNSVHIVTGVESTNCYVRKVELTVSDFSTYFLKLPFFYFLFGFDLIFFSKSFSDRNLDLWHFNLSFLPVYIFKARNFPLSIIPRVFIFCITHYL